MIVEFLGKFYNNHSLSIVNRNIVLNLHKLGVKLRIVALDSYDPIFALDKSEVRILKQLENAYSEQVANVQVRHTYPPMWNWPVHEETKVVYIQPWEYPKAPFEWQYKFETFADALIVPSNFCKQVFINGGIKPGKTYVIPNGINTDIFNKEAGNSVEKFGINKDKFNFVYVGNSQWRKGLDILLHAWSKVFTKADNAKLIIKDSPSIYGPNDVLQQIIKLQYKTNCAEIIYIDSDLSDKDMANIYKASKVIVHPYRAEGFAMHVQEAVACGCLPIISAKGPTEDYIPLDQGVHIPVTPMPINIQDPRIFALKPGDATTLMSTHTFINEPNAEYLINALGAVYHSHDKEQLFSKINNITIKNSWELVASQYLKAITEIASIPNTVR